ncbi:hypothetical protein U9M48_016092 [Paspalum notatum var. saurae]|uniref:Uncharacterized protein n=1 Tax=Paspalum notatum var. saurae TaxID=547442 RepID=A0AAQ3WMN4_PASNO
MEERWGGTEAAWKDEAVRRRHGAPKREQVLCVEHSCLAPLRRDLDLDLRQHQVHGYLALRHPIPVSPIPTSPVKEKPQGQPAQAASPGAICCSANAVSRSLHPLHIVKVIAAHSVLLCAPEVALTFNISVRNLMM